MEKKFNKLVLFMNRIISRALLNQKIKIKGLCKLLKFLLFLLFYYLFFSEKNCNKITISSLVNENEMNLKSLNWPIDKRLNVSRKSGI